MSNLPSTPFYIQSEETLFESPVSESTVQKMGSTMNYLLDHYPIPPGMTIEYNGPEGSINLTFMIPEDGRAVSRSTYANLFAAIGTYHGIGDGVTTFNVPDKRGRFRRMVDLTAAGQANRDPAHAGRTPTGTGSSEDVGSVQGQAIIDHNHFLPIAGGSISGAGIVTDGGPFSLTTDTTSFGAKGVPTGESRPINYYVLLCIKT